ncbi:MAG: GAF domain-containing sensor histidine kinase [Chloroflexota bacterium]
MITQLAVGYDGVGKERLDALRRAVHALTSEQDLPAILRGAADVSREVAGARHAALVTLDQRGQLIRFITSGLTEEEVAGLGPTMEARGLIGSVIRDRRPIRLPALELRNTLTGFPPGYPRISSFLGVPLSSHTRTFGGLYVTSKDEAPSFSAEDEELLLLLASHASIAIESARLYAMAQRSAREAQALYEVGKSLNRSLSLDDVLQRIVQAAATILRADKAQLFVLDEAKGVLRARALHGFMKLTPRLLPIRLGQGLIGRVPGTGQSIVVQDTLRRKEVIRWIVLKEGIRSLIHVPIRINQRVYGVLSVNYLRPNAVPDRAQFILESLADQAATAIQNARLYSQVERLARGEERDRIARDLHDSVIQEVYAVGLSLETCIDSVEREPDKVKVELQSVVQQLNRVIKDIRAYIHTLRTGVVPRKDLVRSLEEMVEEMRGRAPFHIEFTSSPKSVPDLASYQVQDLLLVAQEALANVLKHARATRVDMALTSGEGRLTLSIWDNGVGFDPRLARGKAQHGLRNIRARARRLGAALRVDAAPGKGTRLVLRLPLPHSPPGQRR